MTNSFSQAANNLLAHLVMDLKNGYLRRCESLGMIQKEMQALSNLSIEEMQYLTNSQVSVLTIQIHHENLFRLLEHAQRELKRMQIIDRAIALGGSFEFLQHFFGLSSVEVAARRRIAGIEVRAGRGNVLSETESAELWRKWQLSKVADVNSAEGLAAMMSIAEGMNMPLTAAWHAIKSWNQETTITESDKKRRLP